VQFDTIYTSIHLYIYTSIHLYNLYIIHLYNLYTYTSLDSNSNSTRDSITHTLVYALVEGYLLFLLCNYSSYQEVKTIRTNLYEQEFLHNQSLCRSSRTNNHRVGKKSTSDSEFFISLTIYHFKNHQKSTISPRSRPSTNICLDT
jgi:hypothetical protein